MLSFNEKKIKNGEIILINSNDQTVKGIYYGENLNKKKRYGILYFSNRIKYEGQWNDKKRDGFGIVVFENGTTYKGQWKDDMKNG